MSRIDTHGAIVSEPVPVPAGGAAKDVLEWHSGAPRWIVPPETGEMLVGSEAGNSNVVMNSGIGNGVLNLHTADFFEIDLASQSATLNIYPYGGYVWFNSTLVHLNNQNTVDGNWFNKKCAAGTWTEIWHEPTAGVGTATVGLRMWGHRQASGQLSGMYFLYDTEQFSTGTWAAEAGFTHFQIGGQAGQNANYVNGLQRFKK